MPRLDYAMTRIVRRALSRWFPCFSFLAILGAFAGMTPAALRGALPARAEDETRPAADESAENRLLQGELLEVASGDLEKAMAIYRSIQADAKASEATRSRAALYQARCHRKLGELDAARKLLDQLVKSPGAGREVQRQAQGFLRELTGGRAENADFDWLKELEKSPEIQARVFELGMDLVNMNAEAGGRAMKQLVALGAIAVPVLEKLLETSRDPQHRFLLATLLLYNGRFERLRAAAENIDKVGDVSAIRSYLNFVMTIPDLNEADRQRLLKAIDELPAKESNAWFKDFMKVWAGELSNLPAKLASVAGKSSYWSVDDRMYSLLRTDAAVRKEIAAMILDDRMSLNLRIRYIDNLRALAPELLGVPHWMVYFRYLQEGDNKFQSKPEQFRFELEKLPAIHRPFYELERLGAFEELVRMARDGEMIPAHLLSYFWSRYGLTGSWKEASGKWGAVLRAVKKCRELKVGISGRSVLSMTDGFSLLQALAARNDGAIPEFTGLLRNRKEEAPEFRGFPPDVFEAEAWVPTPAFVEVMSGLLDADDLVVVFLALKSLLQAPKETSAEVFARVEAVLEKSTDAEVRSAALRAILQRFTLHPETGPQTANLLQKHFKGLSDEVFPSRASERALRSVPRARVRVDAIPEATLQLLYPHILDLADSDGGAELHEAVFSRLPDKTTAVAMLLERLKRFKNARARETATQIIRGFEKEASDPRATEFLNEVAFDRRIGVETRFGALVGVLAQPRGWDFTTMDWQGILSSDDPVVERFLNPQNSDIFKAFREWMEKLEPGKRTAILEAALKSPSFLVREWALKDLDPGPRENEEMLRKALLHGDDLTRVLALHRLSQVTRADIAPVFLKSLEDPSKKVRLRAIPIIKNYALPESLEPLGKLLGDPDIEVRGKALEALKDVRKTLEEKKEWEKTLESLKARKTEGG